MNIYIKDVVDKSLIDSIPALVVKVIRDRMNTKKCKKMNNYLETNFNITLTDVINQLRLKGFKIYKVKNMYCVQLDRTQKEKKTKDKLVNFISLIDYGNSEIKGINLVDKSMQYISDNILNIYRAIQVKGEK